MVALPRSIATHLTEHGLIIGCFESDQVTDAFEFPVSGLNSAFRESVDDYLATCRQNGRDPDKPFKGTLN